MALPIDEDDPRTVSPVVELMIRKCLAKAPQDRYQSAAALRKRIVPARRVPAP